jgi:sirohydrochlorin cobaltochelatase
MSFSRLSAALAALSLALLVSFPAIAGHHEAAPVKRAIVLAAFGTSYPEALQSILNIRKKVEQAHPEIPVRVAFTSNIIRKIWQERQTDAAWRQANPEVPEDILLVKNTLATMADLQNEGYTDVTVQSLHVFAGEEFHDLMLTVNAMRSLQAMKPRYKPFKRVALGRPALGIPGEAYPYAEDIAAAAKTLGGDVAQAKEMNAALVYMGHGNDYFSTGIYAEFQKAMQRTYGHPVFVACVEGYPAFDDLEAGLKASGKKKILMKPFMVVAGDHASNDMAGDEADSWKVMLSRQGYDVTTELRGLGSLDAWADLYVDHLNDAMGQSGLLR